MVKRAGRAFSRSSDIGRRAPLNADEATWRVFGRSSPERTLEERELPTLIRPRDFGLGCERREVVECPEFLVERDRDIRLVQPTRVHPALGC